jgi:hypothetical protein
MSSDDDKPKRLAHTKEVPREIFLKSGNLCASGLQPHYDGQQGEFYRPDLPHRRG